MGSLYEEEFLMVDEDLKCNFDMVELEEMVQVASAHLSMSFCYQIIYKSSIPGYRMKKLK
ncbi:hypothetical protein ACE6H2_002631 [Prunus campanulata]